MGKRDASFDLDLPFPRKRYRPGVDAMPQPAPASWKITGMNDQHAYLPSPLAMRPRLAI